MIFESTFTFYIYSISTHFHQNKVCKLVTFKTKILLLFFKSWNWLNCFDIFKASVLGVTLQQDRQVLVKAVGKTSYFHCKVNDLQSWNYIHWYQKKEGEALSRLLYITAAGIVTHDTNNPQANDFTLDKTQLYNLKISNTKLSHAAVYYCAYWDTSNHSEKMNSHTAH